MKTAEGKLREAIDRAGRQSLESLRTRTPGELMDAFLKAVDFEEE